MSFPQILWKHPLIFKTFDWTEYSIITQGSSPKKVVMPSTWVKRFRVQRSGLKNPKHLSSKRFCLHLDYKAVSPNGLCWIFKISIHFMNCLNWLLPLNHEPRTDQFRFMLNRTQNPPASPERIAMTGRFTQLFDVFEEYPCSPADRDPPEGDKSLLRFDKLRGMRSIVRFNPDRWTLVAYSAAKGGETLNRST